MGSRFPVSGAIGGGRWFAVLLGFLLVLASTLEAIPTRGAAGYLEMSSGGRTYDGLNRVTSYTEAGKTIGYRYYASGKLAKVIYPDGSETGLGHVEYTYNADGRLYQVIDRLSSTTSPRTTTYAWNTDGRLASVTRPNGTVRTISYDTAGRPSGISDAGIVWGIGYYASDEIKTLDVTPAVPARQLAAVPAAAMTFDAANRLATFNGQTVTHDADGNMLTGPQPTTGAMGNYTYDSRNRLTGAGGFAYRYNAEGNRVGLTSANETTTLTVDPQGALPKVLERVKNGVRTRYVYGAGLQYEVNDAGAATYYHYDQSGNTAALTNQAGAIIERVVYSPYGTIRYRQSNFDTPFLYSGFFGVMTDANGLIAMRARYYNPLTMRFLNSDPAMDGLNWYAYANGNPINFADPTGLMQLDLVQGLVEQKLKWEWEINVKPPTGPAGSSVDFNISEAARHKFDPSWFYSQVKNNGPWDYKQQGGGYQNQAFGNFNYGAAGSAHGFPSTTLKRMAGWAQTKAGTSNPDWGNPGKFIGKIPVPFTGTPPYGDDPDDQYWINAGIRYEHLNTHK